jgi:hypothetical protein
MVEYEHWQQNKPGCRSSGCRLQFGGAENGLLATRLQKCKTLFSAARTHEQLKALSALVWQCDARHFILNAAVRNSALALH